MDWYVIDKDYVDYLTSFDARVGYVDYGSRVKLHIGVLLSVNNRKYYAPVSSPKPKHNHMSNGIDFQKIQDDSTGYLYAVININNMIPVPDTYVTQVKYNQISNYRSFSSEKEETDYIYLLQQEKAIIDTLQSTLEQKAMKLYNKCKNNPNSSLASRCCDFSLLEEKADEYVPSTNPLAGKVNASNGSGTPQMEE